MFKSLVTYLLITLTFPFAPAAPKDPMYAQLVASTKKEKRIQIAVMDTGINLTPALVPYMCVSGHKDMTGQGLQDAIGHGTEMAYLIANEINPDTHCLIIIKWMGVEQSGTPSIYFVEGMQAAAYSDAMYINVSGGGRSPNGLEDLAISYGLANGKRWVVAAGNDGQDMTDDCSFFPACFVTDSPNLHVVGALDPKGKRAVFSNYGGPVKDWELGIVEGHDGHMILGTSPATAIATGKLAAREYREGKVR